ncbi:hypothetical protein C2S52_021766 [Perilla frutescens var. hirtella]|nr:hypothetical protein C2S52_021766 [Perilla frutescens var. hirtella]
MTRPLFLGSSAPPLFPSGQWPTLSPPSRIQPTSITAAQNNPMADKSATSTPKEIKDMVEENIVEQLGNEIIVLGDDDTTNVKIIESLSMKEEGGKSSKKLSSDAWNHFKLISVKGVEKAKCNYYSALLSYKGRNGTSHLLKHANLVCPRRHLRMGIGQTQLNVKTEDDETTVVELKDRDRFKTLQGRTWLIW